jgi:6-phosphofructokinase 1
VTGIKEGWKGLLSEGLTVPLTIADVKDIQDKGGTILKTSRTNPFKRENGLQLLTEGIRRAGLDALAAIGGEDTMGVAYKLSAANVQIIGIPKTIDNDLSGTDYAFGFDSALNIVIEAIDRVRTTTESHSRIMIVEVMGRHAGWIALEGGMAGSADAILIPERPVDMDDLCERLKKHHASGQTFSIVVVAEGAKISLDSVVDKEGSFIVQDLGKDEFGHLRLGGIGTTLAREIEKRTGIETRMVILGHVQRGGAPSAFDRYLTTRFGIHAVELIHQGQTGKMVSLRGNQIVAVPLGEAVEKTRTVPPELYAQAELFFA